MPRTFRLARFVVTVAALFGCASAAATIVTFDFDGLSPATPTKVFTDPVTNVSLTVTALYREPPGFLPALVTQRANGIGVLSDGEAGGEGELDSFGANEVLVWTLSGAVGLRLEQVVFGNWEAGNDFQLYSDFASTTDLQGPGLVPGPPAAFNPLNPWSPSDHGVVAEAHDTFAMKVVAAGGAEAFRVSGMTFTTVPEPATALLLAAGLVTARLRLRFRA